MDKDMRFLKKWKEIRKGGKERYIFSRGLILGIALAAGAILGGALRGHGINLDTILRSHFLGGFIGGAIGAGLGWKKSEKRYDEIIITIREE